MRKFVFGESEEIGDKTVFCNFRNNFEIFGNIKFCFKIRRFYKNYKWQLWKRFRTKKFK